MNFTSSTPVPLIRPSLYPCKAHSQNKTNTSGSGSWDTSRSLPFCPYGFTRSEASGFCCTINIGFSLRLPCVALCHEDPAALVLCGCPFPALQQIIDGQMLGQAFSKPWLWDSAELISLPALLHPHRQACFSVLPSWGARSALLHTWAVQGMVRVVL